jgi:hypothetical protein
MAGRNLSDDVAEVVTQRLVIEQVEWVVASIPLLGQPLGPDRVKLPERISHCIANGVRMG